MKYGRDTAPYNAIINSIYTVDRVYDGVIRCYIFPYFFTDGFAVPNIIDAQILQLDFTDTKYHCTPENVFIGRKARHSVEHLDANTAKKFYSTVVEFYVESTLQHKKRLPLQDEVVKSLSVIDAKHRSFTNLDALLKRFSNLVREHRSVGFRMARIPTHRLT